MPTTINLSTLSNKQIDHLFHSTLSHVSTTGLPRDDILLSKQESLELRSLFKQATQGDCHLSKPYWFRFDAVKEWNAWDKLRGMSKTESQREYLMRLLDVWPELTDELLVPIFEEKIKDVSDEKVEFPLELIRVDEDELPRLEFASSERKPMKNVQKNQDYVTVANLKEMSDEMKAFLRSEIKLLKTSLRESMRRLADLEYDVTIHKEEMEQEASLDKLLKMDIDKSNSNVQEILDNIRQTYVLVNQQLDETRKKLQQRKREVEVMIKAQTAGWMICIIEHLMWIVPSSIILFYVWRVFNKR